MLNKTELQGRLVADPTFGQTTGGKAFANFRLAWSKKIGEKESKCFLECKAFNNSAEFMQKYLNRKGQEMIVVGELNTDEWTGQDGQKRSKLVLLVSETHFSGRLQTAATSTQEPSAETSVQDGTPVDDEELPF